MLSHHEQRELERIQERFERDDPQLAKALGQVGRPCGWARSRLLRYSLDLVALVLIVIGAVTLNFGLIFFGAVCLAAGACLHVTKWHDEPVPRHRRLE